MDKFFGQRNHHSENNYIRVNSYEIARNEAAIDTGCSNFFKRYIDSVLEKGGLSNRFTDKKSSSLLKLLQAVISESDMLNQASIDSQIYTDEELLVDRVQIKFAITQILENAVQYSEGERSVTVNLDNTPKALLLIIKDTGIGIDQFEKDKIFKPFFRGLDSFKFSKGIGLGLTLAREILTYHDAEISIESQGRGFGTAAYISFPIEDKRIVYRDIATRPQVLPSAATCT